jgi:hypothetical protein
VPRDDSRFGLHLDAGFFANRQVGEAFSLGGGCSGIDVILPLSSLLLILLPEGERASSVASIPTVSFTALPEWLVDCRS